MKTIKNLLTAIIVLFTMIAAAQEGELDTRENLKFGLKAGVNYSNVYNSKTEEFRADSKFGFAGGGFLTIPISKYIGVQPEFLIAQKGFKGEGVILGSPYNFTRTTTYIDIPLQFAIKPSEFMTFLVGPQYSYLIKQTDEFTNTLFSTTQEQEFKNEDIFKNIFSAVVGLDIVLRNVVLGGRIGWDLRHNNGSGTSTTPRYKNAWLQTTVGFNF